MKTSPKGMAFLAAHEGVVTRAYRDVKGVWTIGIGHTAAAGVPRPKAGMTMTRAEARGLLAADLTAYEPDVEQALGPLSQAAFDGAVSFHFNTGAIARATWVKQFRAGALAEAEAALKQWNKSGGKVYPGLVRRRAEEAELIFRGSYPAGLERPDRPAGAATASDHADAAELGKALAELGYLAAGEDASPKTLADAVERFQAGHDLVVDGIAGPATRAGLARAVAAKRATSVVVGVGGAGAAAGGIDAATPPDASIAPAEPAGVVMAAIGWGLIAAFVVGLGFLVWRYRGAIGFFVAQQVAGIWNASLIRWIENLIRRPKP